MERCSAITAWLMNRPSLKEFCQPIVPGSLPDYSKIVPTPMDFATIQKNLSRRYYASAGQWCAQVALVFDNAVR
jgi:hypothetical protein